MAIQKNITDEFGVTHSAAYTRVISVFIHPDSPNSASMEVDAFVEIFHDAASRSKSDVSLIKTPFIASAINISGSAFTTYFADGVLDNDGVSPFKQAYAYIKAQSDLLGQNWTTGTTDV